MRNPKARAWLRGRRNFFDQPHPAPQPKQQVFWMHCASLGEFEQGRPVLDQLRSTYPDACTVITFFSPSGFEAAKNYTGATHRYYLPMDSAANAKQFINLIRPTLVLWIKYEYWYHYLTEIHRRRIPLLLVAANFNSRQVFFRWYGGFFRKMLRCFTWIFVQTEASGSVLEKYGFSGNVTVSGDTRFDRVTEIAGRFQPMETIRQFCAGRQVIVAGSTWPEDETVLQAYLHTCKGCGCIIAPHEITPARLQQLQQRFPAAVLYSQWNNPELAISGLQPAVLIIDNIGMLSRLYRYATVAFVGGGFGKKGLHNILEAAVYGKPVIFGPAHHRFPEAAELIAAGGAFAIADVPAGKEVLDTLLEQPEAYHRASIAAAGYVSSKKGATAAIISVITRLMAGEEK